MGSRKDPSWKYCAEIEVPSTDGVKKSYKYFKCNFCNKEIKGGVKRVKEHLACTHKDVAPCQKVPDEVKDEISRYLKNFRDAKFASQRNFEEAIDHDSHLAGGSSIPTDTNTLNIRGVRGPMDRFVGNVGDDQNASPSNTKELRNQVCMDIGRFFFENGIPFNVATSPSYHSMLRSVGAYGRGLKPPTMHELRTWILKEEVKTTTKTVDEIKATWIHTGVSLLSDGWSDIRNRSLINFLVNNQHGTVFLKTVDASDCVKDAQKLFELLDGVIEEIGGNNVVQVVTDNASAYKAAGTLLMNKRPTLYWTPCVAHCIDLMLEKIGDLPQHKNALLKAKRVTNFIHNHQWVLSLARKIAKKDLVRPAATRFATAFLTLDSMAGLKRSLQQMFVSRDWENCAWAKKSEGKAVKRIVMDERVFWPSVVYAIKTTKPLVNVLRVVDGETPAMGFIYGAMDEAKKAIADNLDKNEAAYSEIWSIIDSKWDNQLHRDLHAAGYFLNPRYKWPLNSSPPGDITRGLLNCMERLVKNNETYNKIESQLDEYKYKRGLFAYRGAQSSYMTRPPVEWWDTYGADVPELRSFAMKVLGLTCSASECERNWSTFNQVHTKRRNRLTTGRMNSLVYIMYNRKLKHRFLKKKNRKESEDPLIVDNVSSDDEWTANPTDETDNDEPIRDEAEGSNSRKRKSVQIDLEDEESGEEDDDYSDHASDHNYDGGAFKMDHIP